MMTDLPSVPRRTAAFTLIELLISLALTGIILSAIVYVNIETVRSSASLQSRNEMLADAQVAQNYIASKMKQAVYIFPVGSNIQMVATAGVNTASKPGGGNNWKVGTEAVVAFILPPKVVLPGRCASSTGALASQAADYCYAFYAYYAMSRGDYVAATSGADDPGSGGANDATSWEIIEYRAYYSPAATNFASGFSAPSTLSGYSTAEVDIPTGNRGRLLLDYLLNSNTAPPLFVVANAPATGQTAGVANVTMNIAVQRNIAGQAIQLPGITTETPQGRYVQTVYPRNIGQTPLSN